MHEPVSAAVGTARSSERLRGAARAMSRAGGSPWQAPAERARWAQPLGPAGRRLTPAAVMDSRAARQVASF